MDCKVLVVVDILFVLIIFADEELPLIFEVKVLIDEDKVLFVEEATAPPISKLDVTPFTFELNSEPLKDKVLEDITELVEVTPLIVVVKVLPDRDWVKEEMILEIFDDIPFIIN